jgi:hypothetical protein
MSGVGESEVPLSPAERGAQQRRVHHEPVGAGTGGEAFPDPGASNQSRRSRETTTRSCCRSLFRPESYRAFPESLRDITLRCRMARLSTAERTSNGFQRRAGCALRDLETRQCATHRSRHSALGNEQAPTEVGEGPAASVLASAGFPGRRAPRAAGERSSPKPRFQLPGILTQDGPSSLRPMHAPGRTAHVLDRCCESRGRGVRPEQSAGGLEETTRGCAARPPRTFWTNVTPPRLTHRLL